MTIQEKINAQFTEARKLKNNKFASSLSIIKAEFARESEKEISDEKAKEILNFMLKGARKCNNEDEVKLYSSFLPKLMDEAETTITINAIISEHSLQIEKGFFGQIMRYLNHDYKGKVDNNIAKQVINSILNGST